MIKSKPFLQWAGGKNRLIPLLNTYFPCALSDYDTYIEPFVGAGAMTIHLLANGYKFKKVIINDLNPVLMNTYRIIQRQPYKLLEHLEQLQQEYDELTTMEDKRVYFLKLRGAYNTWNQSLVLHTALFIFLNKTGFSGLFRVNSKNEFNVSFGKLKKPIVFCRENIIKIHDLLQGVEICSQDFAKMRKRISGKTFIYLDPPYYPISQTAGFCSYTAGGFNEREQIRLADFCKSLSCDWMLSNSDSHFISSLYKNFHIRKIATKHFIRKSTEVTELLITNY